MTQRLLLFMAALREAAPGLRWSFYLCADHSTVWDEAQLRQEGLPPTPCCSILIEAQCPIPHGFLTAERAISPQRASRFFASEAREIAREIQAELARRLPQYTSLTSP